MSKSTPHLIARAATIRQSIAALERHLLSVDCPKQRAQERERLEQLRSVLRRAV